MKKTLYFLSLFVAMSCTFLNSASLFAASTDDRIESAAKQTYVFRTYLKNDNIKVSSKAGDVTLTGTVNEEGHKSLAKDTVVGLPGVKSVDDKLTLKGKPSTTGSDTWLIAKVKFTLLFHKNVNASGTKVNAKKGAVTLRGKATSVAQKDLTTEYVGDVDGVKSVTNEMTVPGAVKQGKSTAAAKMDDVGDAVDDASITAMAKATLFYHRSTSALNTSVATKDGIVTLSGKAKNNAEKDLAEKLVLDVRGVNKVVNNITVG
jgi:osmotically-inducible protein OsmY